MATQDVKRSIPAAQQSRRPNTQLAAPARRHHQIKLRAYETLYRLNRGFNITAFHFNRLERLGIFNADDLRALRAYRSTCEEARALVNADLLLALHEQEMEDSVRFQKLRIKWEKRLKRPLRPLKPQNQKTTSEKSHQ